MFPFLLIPHSLLLNGNPCKLIAPPCKNPYAGFKCGCSSKFQHSGDTILYQCSTLGSVQDVIVYKVLNNLRLYFFRDHLFPMPHHWKTVEFGQGGICTIHKEGTLHIVSSASVCTPSRQSIECLYLESCLRRAIASLWSASLLPGMLISHW